MKLKNLYLISMALLAGSLFAGCNDDTETFDNQVYVNASVKTSNILLKATMPNTESSFQIAIAKPENEQVTISLKADPSLTTTYNAAYYSNAEALPEGYYSIPSPQTTILPGSILSEDVIVKFNNLDKLDDEKIYVLPVTIDQASIGILQSARTMYYVLKGAALINVVANIDQNSIYVNWTTPDVVNDMKQMSAEALIRVSEFGKMLSTIMGIEGKFLLRVGDSGIHDNQLQLATGSGNITSSDLAIPLNEWTHIAVTYDSEAKKAIIYINGKNKLEATLDYGPVNWGETKTDEGNGFWIGHSYNYDRWLSGDISECRVWNRVLTQEEINSKDHFYEVLPESEGLVAYWKFNDKAGNLILDHTNNGNNATAEKAITWVDVELPVK